jgi:hypothetical protein
MPRRPSSLKKWHAMGYDHVHRRRRAALLPSAVGTLCSICGQPMTEGQALDLHHVVPLAIAPNSTDVIIVHASCNRGVGHHRGDETDRHDPASFCEKKLGAVSGHLLERLPEFESCLRKRLQWARSVRWFSPLLQAPEKVFAPPA